MSIQQNFPAITPSLSLNFARSKKLDPRITFTRTSSATRTNETGLVEVVPANAPRFDHSYDSVSGSVKSLGLLVEEARSNLITITTNNENGLPITDFNYPMNGFDENNTQLDIAPDGNLVLCKYDLAGTNGPFLNINSTASITAGVTYTMSMWVKGGSSYNASFAWANQTTNEVPNTTISITPEWRRYTFSFTPQFNSTSSRLQIFFATQGNDKVISVWGAQLEQGSFATSYIPRPSGQATRTADNVSMVGENFSSWYNPSEGTIYAQFRCDNWNASNSFGKVFTINEGIFGVENNGFWIGNDANTSNSVRYRVRASGTNQFGPANLIRTSNVVKSALSVKTSDFAVTINGNAPTSSTSGTLSTSMTNMTIGRDIVGIDNAFLNGHIAQLTYYPRRLSNTQLQNLTR
jgi:hypothetical protein